MYQSTHGDTITYFDSVRKCQFGIICITHLPCFQKACYMYIFNSGFVVNGINNVNTTSLERRFGLSSSQVSLVASSYDISAGLLTVPITYFGAFAHQPRMLSFAALTMALGSLLMSLPHFITGLYELKEVSSDQCITGKTMYSDVR